MTTQYLRYRCANIMCGHIIVWPDDEPAPWHCPHCKSQVIIYDAPVVYTPASLEHIHMALVPQSVQFMIDLLPTIRRYSVANPTEVLDVGTACGAGASLLATLHKSDVLIGPRMMVDALDIEPDPLKWGEENLPNVREWICGLLEDQPAGKTWDLIVCSHVVEHLQNPLPLIEECQRRSRWAIFYAPYEEDPPLPYHNFVVRQKWVLDLDPIESYVMTSLGWRPKWDDPSNWRTTVFVLKGTGRQ